MTEDNEKLARVYAARTNADRAEAYDAWASEYDADLASFGFRLPGVAAALCARFVAPGAGPILDAGCGTGLQADPLKLAGYGPIIGADLSRGMLDVARDKEIYEALHQVTLGEPLPFIDGKFAATLCLGAMTPGHAPPESLDELIRVTRVGGYLIFSLRADEAAGRAYNDAVDAHEAAGRWRRAHTTGAFVSMPRASATVRNEVFAYRRLA